MKPLNYTAAALESLKTNLPLLLGGCPTSAMGLLTAVDMLKNGVKFQLPDYGRYFPIGTRRGDFLRQLKMPFPVCILEFFTPARNDCAETAHIRKAEFFPHRRIAICFDTHGHPDPSIRGTMIENSIVVVAAFEADRDDWIFAPSMAVLNNKRVTVNAETGIFTIVPEPFINEIYFSQGYTPEMAVLDISDEVTAAVEFMMTVNSGAHVTRQPSGYWSVSP